MDIETVAWIVAIACLVGFGGLLFWLMEVLSRDRLMRCPETGSVTFVRIGHVVGGEGKEPAVAVKGCELWPQKAGCAQGCLARYGETSPGLRVNLHALRPFELQ